MAAVLFFMLPRFFNAPSRASIRATTFSMLTIRRASSRSGIGELRKTPEHRQAWDGTGDAIGQGQPAYAEYAWVKAVDWVVVSQFELKVR